MSAAPYRRLGSDRLPPAALSDLQEALARVRRMSDPPSKPLLSRDAKLAAAGVGVELGILYGLPLARLLVQLAADLDVMARSLTSWAQASGKVASGARSGLLQTLEGLGADPKSAEQIVANVAAARARSQAAGDLAQLHALMGPFKDFEFGWVV